MQEKKHQPHSQIANDAGMPSRKRNSKSHQSSLLRDEEFITVADMESAHERRQLVKADCNALRERS